MEFGVIMLRYCGFIPLSSRMRSIKAVESYLVAVYYVD